MRSVTAGPPDGSAASQTNLLAGVPRRMGNGCGIRHEWRMTPCDHGTSVPAVMLIAVAVIVRGVIGGGEDGDVADVGERGPAAEDRLRRDVVGDLGSGREIGGEARPRLHSTAT